MSDTTTLKFRNGIHDFINVVTDDDVTKFLRAVAEKKDRDTKVNKNVKVSNKKRRGIGSY